VRKTCPLGSGRGGGRRRGRKRWILSVPLRGELWMDVGAVRAVAERGKSLFSAGIVRVAGDFAAQARLPINHPCKSRLRVVSCSEPMCMKHELRACACRRRKGLFMCTRHAKRSMLQGWHA